MQKNDSPHTEFLKTPGRFWIAVFMLILAAVLFAGTLLYRNQSQEKSKTVVAHSTPLTAYLDFSPVVSFIGFYAAEEQGLFRDAGLRVTFKYGKGAADAATVIASGRYPLGTSSGQATILARGKGGDIVSLAVLYPNPSTVVVSNADNPVRTPRDLIGKRIGINQASATYNDFQWILSQYNLQRSKIDEVQIGFDYTPFVTGSIDAYFNYAEQMPSLASHMSPLPIEVSLTDWGLQGYGFNVIANEQYCSQHPSVCSAFVRAVLQGYQWAKAHPDAATKLFIHRFPEQNVTQTRNELDRVITALGPGKLGSQTRLGWATTISTAKQSGIPIQGSIDPGGILFNITD